MASVPLAGWNRVVEMVELWLTAAADETEAALELATTADAADTILEETLDAIEDAAAVTADALSLVMGTLMLTSTVVEADAVAEELLDLAS